MQTEQSEHSAAEHRADDAEQQIHQEAVAAAAHDLAGQKAGKNPNHDLPNQTQQGCLRAHLVIC